ncbi:MAG: chloride channel protein [Pseudomonadota bacterium]
MLDTDDEPPRPDASKPQIRGLRSLIERAELGFVVSEVGERLKNNSSRFVRERNLLLWVLALGIGIGVAYASLIFRGLLGAIQWLWLGTTSEAFLDRAHDLPWPVVLLAPVLGGLIVGWLLVTFMPGRRANGVADVIEARAINDCKIDPKAGIWSAVISIVSLGFGASAGREGPVVHLGAALASFIEDRFSFDASARRILLACGVAAAVSASFNAPIAGVLFAHEVILAHYAMRAFVPIVISSVVAAVIVRTHLGNFPAFTVPAYDITSYLEFPAFALLGLTCALVAILFEVALMATERVAWRFDIPLWARPAVGGLMIGTIAVFLPEILGVGYGATEQALQRDLPLTLLLVLIVAKTVATAITLASRFGGGIFSPALYLGAMTGGAFGAMAAGVFPELASSQSLYVLLGMGGVAAAVLGAPISTTLIVFELTGGYEMTIALLLTVSISNGVTMAALGQSFFHWQLTRRGLSLQDGPHKEIMQRMTVAQFMSPVPDDEPPPPAPNGVDEPWLMPGDTLERALREFDRRDTRRIAVVSGVDETRVIGWADRVDAVSAFNRALIESHVEEHR